MIFRGLLLFSLHAYLVHGQNTAPPSNSTGCIDGPSTLYVGKVNVTYTGIPCQRWDRNTPHSPRRTPRDGANHNYCRNPDNDPAGTWCYTMDPTVRWQFCKIPKCHDPSLLIMSTLQGTQAQLWTVLADIEVGYPSFAPKILHNETEGQIWATASDIRGKRTFFADIRLNRLGIYSFTSNTSSFQMSGMIKDVEQLAYDWVTKNLYWNDYTKKWIIAVDESFTYYTVIYRNTSESAYYGLALHARQRFLYFTSADSSGRSSIKKTDLSGKNLSIIYPTQRTRPSTIRTLTVDYTDDKIYWTVLFPGFVTMIHSCNLDGSGFRKVGVVTHRTISSMSSYLDFIYLAEHTQYYDNNQESITYRMKVITKTNGGPFRSVVLPSRVRALSVYSYREEFSMDLSGANDSLAAQGSCTGMPPCDQICLPRSNARRECGCMPGYFKSGDTGCSTQFIDDKYLLLVDKAQKSIFQLSLTQSDHSYSAVPTSVKGEISAMCINPINGDIYWYNPDTTTIYKANKNGTNAAVFKSKIHAISMAVNPITFDLYVGDGDTERIYVISSNGQFMKTLSEPPSDNDSSRAWKIQSLSLDAVNNSIEIFGWEDLQEVKLPPKYRS